MPTEGDPPLSAEPFEGPSDPHGRGGRSPTGGIAAGILIGGVAGLVFGLIEAMYVWLAFPLAFDLVGEAFRFLFISVGVMGGAGVMFGAPGGLFVWSLARAARRGAAAPEVVLKRWARYLGLVAAPGAAAFAVLAFRGHRMQSLPAPALLAGLAALSAVGLCFALVRPVVGLSARVAAGLLSRRAVRFLSAALVLAGVLLHVGNARILPRLYPFFHTALVVVTALVLVAAAALWRYAREKPIRLRTLFVLAVCALAAGHWGLAQLSYWPAFRAVVFEDAVAEGRIVSLAGALRMASNKVRPPLPRSAPPPPAGPPLPPGPHVTDGDFFLITVDAMRADRLNARTAPRLSALAGEGVVFDRACSQVPHTSFSLTTLLTGKYAFALAALGRDLARHETLADLFKRERYKTAAFFPPSVFFIDHERFAAVEKGAFRFEYVKYEYMDAPGRTDQVIQFLEGEKTSQVFVWVHYFDPHEPYDDHPDLAAAPGTLGASHGKSRAPGRGDAAARYDGEVRFVDREIGRLVDYLRSTRPRAVIAFTADHGEEFGEHGGRYHGTTLYEEQIHVPLFFVGPGIARRHVAAPVGLVDVAPTLLSLADTLPSARMRGHDLGPWLSTAAAPEARLPPAFAEVNAHKLLATGNERLICDMSRDYCELYDLASDPAEQKNLAGRAPARVATLKAELETWMSGHSTFEREPARAGALHDEATLAALERCRLGDRKAAPLVAPLLGDDDRALAATAARALLRLPDEPSIRDAIFHAQRARPESLLLGALALRAGDVTLAPSLAAAATAADPGQMDPTVRAEVALALVAVQQSGKTPASAPETIGSGDPIHLLGLALPALTDEEVERRVLRALGGSKRPEALAPLLAHLDTVRTRAEVVQAIGDLGDRNAVAPLLLIITGEPYVSARAEEARTLGRLGDRRAVRVLSRLAKIEEEPVVKEEIARALARLSRAR